LPQLIIYRRLASRLGSFLRSLFKVTGIPQATTQATPQATTQATTQATPYNNGSSGRRPQTQSALNSLLAEVREDSGISKGHGVPEGRHWTVGGPHEKSEGQREAAATTGTECRSGDRRCSIGRWRRCRRCSRISASRDWSGRCRGLCSNTRGQVIKAAIRGGRTRYPRLLLSACFHGRVGDAAKATGTATVAACSKARAELPSLAARPAAMPI
jgi:hypothetical protein